jgi:hypothetical protein
VIWFAGSESSCLLLVVHWRSFQSLCWASDSESLAFRSEVGVLVTMLLIPLLIARINAEENLVRAHFGD